METYIVLNNFNSNKNGHNQIEICLGKGYHSYWIYGVINEYQIRYPKECNEKFYIELKNKLEKSENKELGLSIYITLYQILIWNDWESFFIYST